MLISQQAINQAKNYIRQQTGTAVDYSGGRWYIKATVSGRSVSNLIPAATAARFDDILQQFHLQQVTNSQNFKNIPNPPAQNTGSGGNRQSGGGAADDDDFNFTQSPILPILRAVVPGADRNLLRRGLQAMRAVQLAQKNGDNVSRFAINAGAFGLGTAFGGLPGGLGGLVGANIGQGLGGPVGGVIGGVLGTAGAMAATRAIDAFTSKIKQATEAANSFATSAAQLALKSGLTYGQSSQALNTAAAFGVDPSQLSTGNAWMRGIMARGMYGGSGDYSPADVARFRARAMALQNSGPMGRIMAQQIAGATGMEGFLGTTQMSDRAFYGQMARSQQINGGLGASGRDIAVSKQWGLDLSTLGEIGSKAIEKLGFAVETKLLPWFDKAVSWLTSNSPLIGKWINTFVDGIEGAIKSVIKTIYVYGVPSFNLLRLGILGIVNLAARIYQFGANIVAPLSGAGTWLNNILSHGDNGQAPSGSVGEKISKLIAPPARKVDSDGFAVHSGMLGGLTDYFPGLQRAKGWIDYVTKVPEDATTKFQQVYKDAKDKAAAAAHTGLNNAITGATALTNATGSVLGDVSQPLTNWSGKLDQSNPLLDWSEEQLKQARADYHTQGSFQERGDYLEKLWQESKRQTGLLSDIANNKSTAIANWNEVTQSLELSYGRNRYVAEAAGQ